ncbi:hypothetical protein BH23ACT9_BH23ACT9_01160 [soil metagenome]
MQQVGEPVQTVAVRSAPDHGGDARATAVLAVLGGVAPDTVASRYGVARVVLDRWVTSFVHAGREGLVAGAASVHHSDEHRDRYLGLIAHELRSPLAMIQGWADVLQYADDDVTVHDQALKGITTQVDRLRRLADDALDATSVALGRLELDAVPVMLADAVTAVVRARSTDLPSVEIVDDVQVRLDLDRFGQILDNLLENARKHGHGIARLVVRRRGLFGEVVISSGGAPIPHQLARRMFEPFERGTTSPDGVGLGLYVCRSLIVAHGGQLGLTVDDEGNHFWLRLPINE